MTAWQFHCSYINVFSILQIDPACLTMHKFSFTTHNHVLHHLHRWVILHSLSKVTLWYYITLSAVKVEELSRSVRGNETKNMTMTGNEQTCLHVLPKNLHRCPDNLAEAAKRSHTVLACCHFTRKCSCAHHTPSKNCSTPGRQTNAERAKKHKRDWHGDDDTGEVCEKAAAGQKSSCFYLQRRHDIPCPLKPATERCSPCSCCRQTSLAITSAAKKRAAKNPIGFTGAVPDLSKRRHWARRVRGRESRTERNSGGVVHSSGRLS